MRRRGMRRRKIIVNKKVGGMRSPPTHPLIMQTPIFIHVIAMIAIQIKNRSFYFKINYF